MVTWENYEEYIMMHADGELQPHEENALMAFINEHPELRKELIAYEHTRLVPDTTQVFANKDSLLKKEPAAKLIALPQWRRYSIAAGVAAIIFISLFKVMSDKKIEGTIARIDTVRPEAPLQQPIAPEKVIAAPPQEMIAKQYRKSEVKPGVIQAVVRKERSSVEKQKEEVVYTPARPVADRIATLPVTEMQQLKGDAVELKPVAVQDEPIAYALASNSTSDKESFLDRLPIDEIKKAGIENMASAISDKYQQINTVKQNLLDKSLSIKVEKRKLVISF